MKPLCILALASALIIIPSCKKEEPVYNGDGGKTPVPEAVDLGIMIEKADGTEYNVKWASWNLGASSEAEAGDYLCWGEIYAKDHYDWESYKYGYGTNENRVTKYCDNPGDWGGKKRKPDGIMSLLSEDDAATVRLGGRWRIPSKAEAEALFATKENKTDYTWTYETIGGTPGWRITWNQNGNNIFIPQVYSIEMDKLQNTGTHNGLYWIKDLETTLFAYIMCFWGNNSSYCLNRQRFDGMSVRPVCVE